MPRSYVDLKPRLWLYSHSLFTILHAVVVRRGCQPGYALQANT